MDSQQTTSGLPVYSQQTTSRLQVDSQWTPRFQCGEFIWRALLGDHLWTPSGLPEDSQHLINFFIWRPHLEILLGELIWRVLFERQLDSQWNPSKHTVDVQQTSYRLLTDFFIWRPHLEILMESWFGEFFWRDNWTPSGFSALSGIKAVIGSKNIILAIY